MAANMEESSKSPLKSKTVLGLIIALAPDLVEALEKADQGGLVPAEVAPVIRVIGLALAFMGRWGARLPLSLKW